MNEMQLMNSYMNCFKQGPKLPQKIKSNNILNMINQTKIRICAFSNNRKHSLLKHLKSFQVIPSVL